MRTCKSTINLSEQDKFSNHLAIISFVIYSFGIWYSTTNLGSFFAVDTEIIRFLCTLSSLSLACLVIAFRFGKKILNTRGFVAFISVVGLLVIVTLASDNRLLLWISIFVLAFSGKVPLRSLAKAQLCVLAVVGGLTFLGFFIGAIPDSVLSDNLSRGVRHSFGFAHPNTLALYFFVITLSVWPLLKKEDRQPFVPLFLLIAVGVYAITGSRAFFGASILLIFWFEVSWRNSARSKTQHKRYSSTTGILKILFAASLMCAFGSYVALFFYDGNVWFWSIADTAFSGRLSYAKQYLDLYGISLFGQPVGGGELVFYSVPGQANAFLVDNIYDKMLLTYGVVPTIFLLGLYFHLTYQLIKKDDNSYVGFGLLLFALLGVFESVGLRVDANIFLLMLPMGVAHFTKKKFSRGYC